MYRTRIKKWGLDKKKKEKDVRAIVRIKKKRTDEGKASKFLVRGKSVDYADVVHYWKRKRLSIDDVIAQRAACTTPEAVQFSTPLPSPVMAPSVLMIPELIFGIISDYYKRSFGSGMWISTSPYLDCCTIKVQEDASSHLDPLYEQCTLGCHLFAQGSFQEAGQTLISATAGIKMILYAENPKTLSNLFALIINIGCQERHEISLAVLRQFCKLGDILLGCEHPLARICGMLTLVDTAHFDDVIARCLRSAGDHFERILGPMHRSTLYSRIVYVERVERQCDINKEGVSLQHMLSICDQMLGFQDVRTLSIRLSIGFYYLRRQMYFEAQEVGQDVFSHAQILLPVSDGVVYRADGLWIIAHSQYPLGETQSAVDNLREAIDLRLTGWNAHDGRARIWLLQLEAWLVEQGQLGFAAQAEYRRKEILESMEVN